MLIPDTIASTVGPYGTNKCRPVHIRASGEAAALAATASAALREARTEARRQLGREVGRVRTIRWQRAHMWEVWVREYNVFRMMCHCPE